MAYIKNTAFQQRVTNNVYDTTINVTGVFSNGTAGEICSAGFLCVRDGLVGNEGYAGINNSNTWTMIAAPSTVGENDVVFACNTYDVNEIGDSVTGATYRVGNNTLGLAVPADAFATFTRIDFNGVCIYRFGVGNLTTSVGSNGFFTIASGLLVPAAAAPSAAGTPYFQLLGTGNFTQGAYNGFGYVDVLACMA